jgi:hypothetical protein
MAKTAKAPSRSTAKGETSALSLADQLFVISTLKYSQPEEEFLPPLTPLRKQAIAAWRVAYQKKCEPPKGRLLSGRFAKGIGTRWVLRAALFLCAVTGALYLFTYVFDDTIRIVDERGKSAMGSEFSTEGEPVRLRVMRKKQKIGEITVANGSRVKIMKATNGDAFRSEMAFTGTEADFKLKYRGKASLIVNNGPFKAKVRIPPGSSDDVHLKFRELGAPQPAGEPQFAIEVIKGDVQIAEMDEGDAFEHYKAGDKAIFSLEENESL